MNWKSPALGWFACTLAVGLLVHRQSQTQPVVLDTPSVPMTEATATGKRFPTTLHHRTAPPAANGFEWSRVSAANPAELAANLRSVGCPESTMRDLVRSSLLRSAEAGSASTLPGGAFWNPAYGRRQPTARGPASIEQALDALLGPEPEEGPDLTFLPAPQAEAVQEWSDRFAGLEEALPDALDDASQDASDELADRRERELESILTLAQLEDYQLRHSYLADELRSDLLGFDVDEEEFRQVFRALQIEQRAASDGRSENADETIRRVLGDERYARYQRAQDPAFRELLQEVLETGHTYEDALAVQAELHRSQAAANPNDPTATDESPRPPLDPEMQLILLEYAAR